jgi:hypothetical protein
VRSSREAIQLKSKAMASLRRALRAFNDYDDDGRVSTTLLHLQHAFEMLLKACLIQRKQPVFDPRTGRAIGFERCVTLGSEHLRLSREEAGTLRAIDALRDDEQHWLTSTSEGILYLHVRAGVTLFDDLLTRIFETRLVDHLPHRVLPVSAEPPRDIQLLIDEEFSQITQLLQPGRRRRTEARAGIRALLAMESHVRDENVLVSSRDVDRVEKAIRAGGERSQVFPTLSEIGTDISGNGIQITVRFSKTTGMPVRFVGADEDVIAGSIREVDLQRKFHYSTGGLAEALGLTSPRCLALKRVLKIDADETCRHAFTFGKLTHQRYSDNAFTMMRAALDGGIDMEEVWRLHGPRRRASQQT